MTSGFLRNGFFGGLAFRVLLFLSLTLLPIGLVAVLQTQQISKQSQSAAELSLIGVTDQVTANQRTLLQEALGAGRALATVVTLVRDDPRQCSRFLNSYKDEVSKYLLVGFVRSDGIMECSSTFQTYDLSRSEVARKALESGVRTVTAVDNALISGQNVVVVTVPVLSDAEAIGFVFISIQQAALMPDQVDADRAQPRALVTFNVAGEIVSTGGQAERAQAELPDGYTLEQLTGSARQVFSASNRDGVSRVYAVTPIVPQTVFGLSVWPVDTPMLETDFTGRLSALLPIAMWVASLVVAFWALNRLAITHIRKLGRQMRHFALNRTLPRKPLGENLPVEIVAMEKSFRGMAGSILQDEARQEDSLREKNILLKEVHHRVKNTADIVDHEHADPSGPDRGEPTRFATFAGPHPQLGDGAQEPVSGQRDDARGCGAVAA